MKSKESYKDRKANGEWIEYYEFDLAVFQNPTENHIRMSRKMRRREKEYIKYKNYFLDGTKIKANAKYFSFV